MIERMGELGAAARNVRLLVLAQLEREVRSNLLAWFVEAAFAREDPAGEDQGLRLAPALGQAALSEELIEPDLPP